VALYRILSFDGGGIRGLLSTVLVRRLVDESTVSDLVAQADMFAGTSTGGLIALALAADISLQEIETLYVERGPKIFSENFFDQIRDVGNLLGPQYSNKELKRVLGDIFGDRKLGDLKRRVMVPTFTLDNLRDKRADEPRRWKAKIFHNLPNREADKDQLIRDIALYTCSAPTYFPVADGFIDGGVFETTQAFAQSHRRWTGVGGIIRVLAIFGCFRSDQGKESGTCQGTTTTGALSSGERKSFRS
jgi:patatin-like phospholipase/acyl hydrolase